MRSSWFESFDSGLFGDLGMSDICDRDDAFERLESCVSDGAV